MRRWPAIAIVITWLLSMAISVIAGTAAANRAIRLEQSNQARAAEAGRIATCQLVVAQDDVYLDTPPVTPAGKKAASAWHSLRVQFRCDEG